MKKSVVIKVYGKVQGVSFRYYTREKAIGLDVAGFVKNVDDGSVYIEAEGEEEKVNELIKWCKHGPSSARVDKIVVGENKWQGFSGFEIRK
ncbi:MAG: acylphosphatase [Bacteroidota bacterium]